MEDDDDSLACRSCGCCCCCCVSCWCRCPGNDDVSSSLAEKTRRFLRPVTELPVLSLLLELLLLLLLLLLLRPPLFTRVVG